MYFFLFFWSQSSRRELGTCCVRLERFGAPRCRPVSLLGAFPECGQLVTFWWRGPVMGLFRGLFGSRDREVFARALFSLSFERSQRLVALSSR